MQPLTEEQIKQLKDFLALKALCALCNSVQDALAKEGNFFCTKETIRLILDISLRTKDVKDNSKIARLKNILLKIAKKSIAGQTFNNNIANSLRPIYDVINTEYWKMSSKFGIPEPKKIVN